MEAPSAETSTANHSLQGAVSYPDSRRASLITSPEISPLSPPYFPPLFPEVSHLLLHLPHVLTQLPRPLSHILHRKPLTFIRPLRQMETFFFSLRNILYCA